MEIYSFNTDDVETKLSEINAALLSLIFAVNGLKNLDIINENELAALSLILDNALDTSTKLLSEMKPVWMGESSKANMPFSIKESTPAYNVRRISAY